MNSKNTVRNTSELSPTASQNLFSSVISNVTSVLRGTNPIESESDSSSLHKRSVSDSSAFIKTTSPPSVVQSPTVGSAIQFSPQRNKSRNSVSMIGKGDLSLSSLGLPPELEESMDPIPIKRGSQLLSDGPITTEPSQNLAMETALELTVPEPVEFADDVVSITSVNNNDLPKVKHRPSFDSWNRSSRLRSKRSIEKSLTMPALPRVSSKASLDSPLTSTADLNGNNSDDNKPKEESSAKLGSFAFASAKRNVDFHKLFRSLHISDGLVDDFSCALSKEILIQGRLYISERSICFNSNILGWVTNLIISFTEIVGVEKKTTAGLFPNGIIIQTLHGRHTFASFISRDTVYDMITEIWKQASGRRKSDVDFDGTFSINEMSETEDVAESVIGDSDSDMFSSEEYSDDEESDEFNDLDDDDVSSDEEFGETMLSKKKEPVAPTVAVEQERSSEAATAPAPSENGGSSAWPVANLGPETHALTDAGFDANAVGEKLLINETIPAPPGVIANLLFGDDTKWISTFITEKEKNIDLKPMSGFEGGLAAGNNREFEYVKPLNAPVGPKQTRCLCTESIEFWDLTDHVTVVTTTRTPDVPSGGSFSTKTRYNLAWAEGNGTSIIISYMIEWTAKSWFKGPIEKGTHDGQTSFAQNLLSELTASVTKVKGGPSGGANGKKKKSDKKKSKKTKVKASSKRGQSTKTNEVSASGIQGTIESISNLLVSKPLGDAVPIPGWMILLLVIVIYWGLSRLLFSGGGGSSSSVVDISGRITDGHLARELERIRIEQEYDMWQWVTDRTGPAARAALAGGPRAGSSLGGSDDIGYKLKRTLKHESELKEAIKLTELRIRELKLALNV